jgi:transposase-like protein
VFLMQCRHDRNRRGWRSEAASREESKRLVREFETSGLRRSAFCQKHNLAPGTLQRGLNRRRMEVDGQSETKRLVEVKMAAIQRNGSGAEACSLESSVDRRSAH